MLTLQATFPLVFRELSRRILSIDLHLDFLLCERTNVEKVVRGRREWEVGCLDCEFGAGCVRPARRGGIGVGKGWVEAFDDTGKWGVAS